MASGLFAEPVRVAAAVREERRAGPSNFGGATSVPMRTLFAIHTVRNASNSDPEFRPRRQLSGSRPTYARSTSVAVIHSVYVALLGSASINMSA